MDPMRLLYDNTATDVRPALPAVFGALIKLAAPVMTAYHGDLYHDALWLDRHATGREFTFYWSVDTSGTVISDDPKHPVREHAYKLTVINNNGAIVLTVKR